MTISQTPEWVHDAIFYQIFPDRFAKSDKVPKPDNLESWDSPPTERGFKGGDLVGVREHLDYLQDLGINALYFCPVFRSTANHRYHTHDYNVVDPILGGNEALSALLADCHSRGMRVILDGVFNHCSRGFFQFNHILENSQASPYLDWWHVYSWPLNPYGPADQPPGYACWWNLRDLPKFNTSTEAVRRFLWGIGRHWIETGIDGWRLDVPNEIDDDGFWREFRRQVKGANADAYIVGEIWGDASRWLAGDQFDAVMNYPFTRACLGFFAGPEGPDQETIKSTGLDPVEVLTVEQFAQVLESNVRHYRWTNVLSQLNLLDSHDTTRYLRMVRGDQNALKLAWLLQMTFPGVPCVYYGDEVGFDGGDEEYGARRSFSWDRATWNGELLAYLKRLTRLRHETEVLRRGDFVTLMASDDVYSFARVGAGAMAVVAINNGSSARRVNIHLPDGFVPASSRLVWGDQPPNLVGNTLGDWYLPARSGAVALCELKSK